MSTNNQPLYVHGTQLYRDWALAVRPLWAGSRECTLECTDHVPNLGTARPSWQLPHDTLTVPRWSRGWHPSDRHLPFRRSWSCEGVVCVARSPLSSLPHGHQRSVDIKSPMTIHVVWKSWPSLPSADLFARVGLLKRRRGRVFIQGGGYLCGREVRCSR